MKKLTALIVIVVLLVVGLGLTLKCVEKVPQGYVGVVYDINGGIEKTTLAQGWHVVSPTKHVTTYSVATEQLLMTKSHIEGSHTNESFYTVCKDGRMNVDIEMAYNFKAEEVPMVFTKFRGMSGEDVVNNIIKSKVKRYVNEVTSKYTVMEAYMDKKAELNTELTKVLNERLAEYGIYVDSASITRAQLDKQIEDAMVKRSQTAQELETAKQLQQKAEIEAKTKVITAQGEANSAIEKARGEAESNRLISESITPQLIEKMNAEARIEHGWVTIQGGTPIVNAQ